LSNLLIVAAEPGQDRRAHDVFQRAVELTHALKSQRPSRVVDAGHAQVASFQRRNGSGTPTVVDERTGNWLVAVGTWFHDAGYGPGDEARLLARFNEVGAVRLAQELDGFFVIATGHRATREVTVITDVVGTLHCYVRMMKGVVALSVSSMVLAALDDVTLDAVGCQEFLQTGAMYEDRTFFNEVHKLESARCHRYVDGALVAADAYWRVTDLQPDSLDGADSVEAMREAVLAAARRIGKSFPRPAVDLTAGYDSRAGVAAFLTAGVPFETAVGGEPDLPDVVISTELARRAGLRHRHFNPGPVHRFEQLAAALQHTDGEHDLVDYARILEVQSDLASRFDISINSYSGEIGRGYGWEVLLGRTGRAEPLDAASVARKRFVNPGFDASIIAPRVRLDAPAHYAAMVARVDKGLGHLPNTLQYDYSMTMLRCQRWYGRIATSTNQLWPCMSFFLLKSVIKPMLETNTRSRERSLLFRRLMHQIQPALAAYPLDLGYPPLPVAWNTAHRFWPIVPLYGGKVLQRLRRNLPGGRMPTAEASTSPRMQLWRDPAVQDMLRPQNLISGDILEADGAARFIEASKQPQFHASSQWAFLLSLECMLQRLKAVRTERSVAAVQTITA
jgi:hypothetical protein